MAPHGCTQSAVEAQGILTAQLRRRIGVAGFLSLALLRLEKLHRALGLKDTFQRSPRADLNRHRAWKKHYQYHHTPSSRVRGRNRAFGI